MTHSAEKIGFDQLPDAVATLLNEVRELKSLVTEKISSNGEGPDVWFNIDELCEYHPNKPSKATVYGWVCSRQIPYHKDKKNLRFLKSEIDKCLMSAKRKTADELRQEAIATHGIKKGGLL